MTSSGLQDSALKIASRTYCMLRSADPFLWALYAFWDAENLKLGVQNEFETQMKSAVSSRNTIWKKVDDPNMKWRTKRGNESLLMIGENGQNKQLSSFDAIHYLQFEPSIFIGPLIFPQFFTRTLSWVQKCLYWSFCSELHPKIPTFWPINIISIINVRF